MRPLVAGVGSAALGAGVAGLALLVHRLAAAGVPWGLLLAVAASAAGGLALGSAGAGRAGAIGYAAGWCGTVLVALAGRPEGDYIVGGDRFGWGFLLLAFGAVVVVTVLGLAVPRPDRSAPRSHRS